MRNARRVILIIGTVLTFVLGTNSTVAKEKRRAVYVTVVATAYCPCEKCCGENADGLTATGTDAYKAGVAVDPGTFPEGFPLGTHFDIPGYNRGPNGNGSWIRADDTGRAIQGTQIDVRFRTHQEAKEWGRRKIKVRVWLR